MHLVSRKAQHINIANHVFSFKQGESIHTENSYKYTIDEFITLAAQSGFSTKAVRTDSKKLFNMLYLTVT